MLTNHQTRKCSLIGIFKMGSFKIQSKDCLICTKQVGLCHVNQMRCEKVPKLGLVMIHLCSLNWASDFLGSWWGTCSGMLMRAFPERHNWGRGPPTLWEDRWDKIEKKAADRQLSMGGLCPTSHQHWRKTSQVPAAMMSQAYKTDYHRRNYSKLWAKKNQSFLPCSCRVVCQMMRSTKHSSCFLKHWKPGLRGLHRW